MTWKVAYTPQAKAYLAAVDRPLTTTTETDGTDISVVVATAAEWDLTAALRETGFGIPVCVIGDGDVTGDVQLPAVATSATVAQVVAKLAAQYESTVLPPFFRALREYVGAGTVPFDCPGHQGGETFRRTPTGRAFVEFFGDTVFRADLCNADVKLGDLLIHEGPALAAQQAAAQTYHADKTYFVLGGTSAANQVVLNALLAPGDLVLYDRNNHKSICYGALTQAGATPVYVETTRNPYGFIGGIPAAALDETRLRQAAAEKDPDRARRSRPFRVAVIQLGTYDGTIYHARQIVDRIGHLCEYILFDSAWVGYEQFVPMMRDCSPLLMTLGPDDPGIFVTQSVHKQQAGFSQASQIHKKDSHIKGQPRYVNHKRFNNAFMMHASTSPFYPLFASLDVNARMMAGAGGQYIWEQAVKVGIRVRQEIARRCRMFRPFVPPTVHGHSWADGDPDEMAHDMDYFRFVPGETWHSFAGYGEGQYFVDPLKLQLTTPGIDVETGGYTDFGVPATVVAHYLRERYIIPEKCDLNSILFLLTPAETDEKMLRLADALVELERYIEEDAPLETVLPSVAAAYPQRYAGYRIRALCQEMHDIYRQRRVNELQRRLFAQAYLPEYVLSPRDAQTELIRGHAQLLPLHELTGRVALEGALPYPPGVLTVVPGERWSETAVSYFAALLEGIRQLPGFAPEIQGVYIESTSHGVDAFGYVWSEEDTARIPDDAGRRKDER